MTGKRYIEIMDTTLRDGEQTPGVSYTPTEKQNLAKILLTKLKVDRIEVGSARVSNGEKAGAAGIVEWAAQKGMEERIEILGFTDKGKSIDWIKSSGVKVINLLTKGSERHCRIQLGKTPEEHFSDVCREIEYATSQGLTVNVYLEDWSGGMIENYQYIYSFIKRLQKVPVKRIMLPDTLGIMNPVMMARYLDWLYAAFPEIAFDFHGHNDYGLCTANSLAAINAGISGIHTTVNGLGERTGNQTLCELVGVINDMTDCKTRVQEKHLAYTAGVVQAISGKRLAANAPIVGTDVFTQTCGVHADGDMKGNLYANALLPERFSRKRRYALGKLSGKASIDKNLEEMGMELDKELRDKVLREVIRLGDKKKGVTPADMPFIIADVMKSPKLKQFEVLDYDICSKRGSTPVANVKLKYKETIMEASANGDGGYDAFVKATRKALKQMEITLPSLLDYEVRIPPGGKTNALVETTITWANPNGGNSIVTTGVDSDQLAAAITATEKMLNLIINVA
jgi:D-citramalate synthase